MALRTNLDKIIARIVTWLRGLVSRPNVYLNTELKARQRVVTLKDYYKGNQLSYLKNVIDSSFQADEAANMKVQLSIFPLVRYVVDTLCSTFKNGVIVEAVNESDKEIYNQISDNINIDNLMSTVEKYTMLCGTLFVKVGWNEQRGGICADILTPEYVEVVQNTNDPYVIDEIVYPKIIHDINNFNITGEFYYWTPSQFQVVDEKKTVIQNGGEGVNPYSIVPIAVFREHLPTDTSFWEFPSEDLITNQDMINVLIAQRNYVVKMQSWALAVLTNPKADLYGNTNIQVGPGKVLVVESDKERQGKFEYVSPNADISAINASIETEVARTLSSYGLNPSAMIATGDAKSAQSIRETNAAIDEYRTNIRTLFTPAIKTMYSIITQVYNTHAQSSGLPLLSGDGVTVRIQETKVGYASVDEEIKAWGFWFNQRVATPIDYILEKHDDFTRDDAEELYQHNKDFFKLEDTKTVNTGNATPDEMAQATVSGSIQANESEMSTQAL